MRRGDTYTFMFAFAVCLACSLLLSITASVLRERQELNVELDRKANVLKALGVQVRDEAGKQISADKIAGTFDNFIEEVVIDRATGKIIPDLDTADVDQAALDAKTRLPLYQWKEDGEITRYAFPISGKGLWSTIRGYLALAEDLDTILGITFYDHGETPGLGGEIDKDWFQSQFEGKRITEDGELTTFTVLKGKVADLYPNGNPHAVDGISGATMTCKGLNRFLNEDLQNYDQYFARIRDLGSEN